MHTNGGIFVYFSVIKQAGSNYRLLKLTGETNFTSVFNNRFITMTNVWVWAWNQKPWCTDVQRHMHRGEDAEVKSRHLPHYHQPHGRLGLQMTCVKRGHLFIGTLSLKKIKKRKKKLICVSWLSSDFWSRQHGPLFLSGFSIRMVLDHLLTHAIN